MAVIDVTADPVDVPVGVPVGVTVDVDESTRAVVARRVVAAALVVLLAGALWMRRELIVDALAQMRALSAWALVALAALTVYERWSRADIVRRLLGEPVTMGRAVTIHDVGTAVSKGVPFGGAVGTAMRWSIVRESGVRPARFATMLVAYGIATTFVTWLLPFGALLVDLTHRRPGTTDLVILAVIGAVIVGSGTFWMVVLRSTRLESCVERRVRGVWARLARRIPSLDSLDPAAGVADVRRELEAIARRPWMLLGRTLLAQACGALILLVALRSLGVGGELATTEFFRVFFITHLLGSFAPTPGGVGVVEAGATGALVAAGVDTPTALAGVLVYRFLTYVVPILFGAVLYVGWRSGRVRGARARSATLTPYGSPLDAAVPHVPLVADQGFRGRRHALRNDGAAA